MGENIYQNSLNIQVKTMGQTKNQDQCLVSVLIQGLSTRSFNNCKSKFVKRKKKIRKIPSNEPVKQGMHRYQSRILGPILIAASGIGTDTGIGIKTNYRYQYPCITSLNQSKTELDMS